MDIIKFTFIFYENDNKLNKIFLFCPFILNIKINIYIYYIGPIIIG